MPGVGFQSNISVYDNFIKKIGNGLGCEAEMFYWKHEWNIPEIKLPYEDIRRWGCEVILDFQQVVLHAFDMEIPKADYYIGHSAGSILALAQKDSSSIIFGSPAVLVECIHKSKNGMSDFNVSLLESIKNHRNILNIIHKYDQLSYYLDLPNVENYVFSGPWYNPNTYNPIHAHGCYWKDEVVSDKIITTIKNWEEQKVSCFFSESMYNIRNNNGVFNE
jgi:hypothetical protein